MLLINKITHQQILNYKKNIIDCLTYNHSNNYINQIHVYLEASVDNLPNLKNVKYIIKRKKNIDELLDYSKKISQNERIIVADWSFKFSDIELKNCQNNNKSYKIFYRNEINSIENSKNEINLKTSKNEINLKTSKNEINTIDNQIQILNKRLDVIIVSVNYNDFLILTLKNNLKLFENIHVVTSTDDFLCHRICDKFKVNCIKTDIMYDGGSKFNKGKAINLAIDSLTEKGFILILDADILVENQINLDDLRPDTIYSSGRYFIKNYQELKDYESSLNLQNIEYEEFSGLGFFQLFYNDNQRYPENYDDAGWSDLVFRDQFINKEELQNVILHLGQNSMNWKGRITEKFLDKETFVELLNQKPTFTICSYYFNFRNDDRQKNNFIKFLEQWKEYYDKMIVGIVDYGDIDFEIPCQSIILEGDDQNKIWSKEILINKIVEQVDTDYFIWIDGDLIYENLDWLENIDEVAGKNDFVQLFETINYLDENGEISESHKSILSVNPKSNEIDNLLGDGYKPGGSWLGKTSILKEKKLFEQMYVGGGDTIFVYSLFKISDGFTVEKVSEHNINISENAKKWINSQKDLKFSFLNVKVNHLYHGSINERNYNNRYVKLKKINENIDVTILILAHKNSEYLEKCILSAKNQKFNGNLEILLTSDSCNELSYVENKYDIRFTLAKKPIKNTSCSFNFNHGVRESKGKYIKILAYDDFLLEDTIQNLYDKIKSDEFSLIHANCYEVYENDIKKFTPEIKNIMIEDLLIKNQIHGGTIIFNKKDFLETGGLNENLIYAEEYDFYFKLLLQGKKIGYLNKFVYNYRRHSDQKGTLSLTNEEKKNKFNIVERIKDNYRRKKIVCGIATIYDRKKSLKKTITSIIDQVDEIFVYQNGYYEVFDFLVDSKIKVFSSINTGIDKGDAGKFYNVENIKDSYYFSIDDDLIYPSNYVENTIDELKKLNNQSVVSYHGKTYMKEAKSYYKEIQKNYRCLDEVEKNNEIEFPGTGVMCFHTDYLKLRFSDFEYSNMADVFLGIFIKIQNKKCTVLNHKKDWIRHDDINLDKSLFVVNKKNVKIDEVFNRRNLPKFCVVTTMWQRHRLTNFVFSYYNKLKFELRNEINLVLIACGSEEILSRKIAEENGFFYFEKDNFPLSIKHNELFIRSKEFEPDGVVLIGSDDFISSDVLLTYKNLIKDYEYIGLKDFYLLNQESELRFWTGYENERSGEPIGGGRFYRKDFLNKIDWLPWGKLEINRSLDTAFTKNVKYLNLKSKVIECSEENGIIFTIRSSTNITKMKKIGNKVDHNIISRKICNFYELLKLQKEI